MVDLNNITFADVSELAEKIEGITVQLRIVAGCATVDLFGLGLAIHKMSELSAYKRLLELLEKQVKQETNDGRLKTGNGRTDTGSV